jgi:hypothetical protein
VDSAGTGQKGEKETLVEAQGFRWVPSGKRETIDLEEDEDLEKVQEIEDKLGFLKI